MSKPEISIDKKRAERILDKLIEQSDDGAIDWETGGPKDSYAADIGAMRLRLRSRDGNGEAPIILEMWDNQNNLTIQTDSVPSQPSVDQKVLALYQRGKHAALDPSKALRAVEQELGLEPESS